MKPSIQFVTRKDGVKIAYSQFGKGQLLVIPPPWVTSLRFIIEDPYMNKFMNELAQIVTVVFYDKHGCGQSDRNRENFTFESELLDLETVVDHLGLDKFNLFGSSMSGPLSIAYTARHPNKVDRLILYGTYANGTQLAPKELQSAIIALIEASWGLGSKALADVFHPDADAEVLQSHARYQRLSSSPEIAAKLLELCYAVDVTEALSSIKIPTLILHREDDKAMSIQNGRNLSSEISNSNFKILSGNEHPMWDGESNDIIKEILEFIGESESRGYITNKAAYPKYDEAEIAEQVTIMFTDIVSSTDIVTEIGDAEARNLFAQHDKIIQELVNKYGGTELQNLGDGFMLSFPSATSAIQCACALQIAISQNIPLIKVKIGINTGEVVKREGKHPFGQAVVIASRIVEECSGKQILISDISKRLAAGSKFEFLEIGKFKPKGLDYNVELFEVVWAE